MVTILFLGSLGMAELLIILLFFLGIPIFLLYLLFKYLKKNGEI